MCIFYIFIYFIQIYSFIHCVKRHLVNIQEALPSMQLWTICNCKLLTNDDDDNDNNIFGFQMYYSCL